MKKLLFLTLISSTSCYSALKTSSSQETLAFFTLKVERPASVQVVNSDYIPTPRTPGGTNLFERQIQYGQTGMSYWKEEEQFDGMPRLAPLPQSTSLDSLLSVDSISMPSGSNAQSTESLSRPRKRDKFFKFLGLSRKIVNR